MNALPMVAASTAILSTLAGCSEPKSHCDGLNSHDPPRNLVIVERADEATHYAFTGDDPRLIRALVPGTYLSCKAFLEFSDPFPLVISDIETSESARAKITQTTSAYKMSPAGEPRCMLGYPFEGTLLPSGMRIGSFSLGYSNLNDWIIFSGLSATTERVQLGVGIPGIHITEGASTVLVSQLAHDPVTYAGTQRLRTDEQIYTYGEPGGPAPLLILMGYEFVSAPADLATYLGVPESAGKWLYCMDLFLGYYDRDPSPRDPAP